MCSGLHHQYTIAIWGAVLCPPCLGYINIRAKNTLHRLCQLCCHNACIMTLKPEKYARHVSCCGVDHDTLLTQPAPSLYFYRLGKLVHAECLLLTHLYLLCARTPTLRALGCVTRLSKTLPVCALDTNIMINSFHLPLICCSMAHLLLKAGRFDCSAPELVSYAFCTSNLFISHLL